MMQEVGVNDFTSRDVTKPEAERVRRVLSAVINFAKFREDRQPAFFQEMREADEVIDLIVDREKEHEQMTQELENLKYAFYALFFGHSFHSRSLRCDGLRIDYDSRLIFVDFFFPFRQRKIAQEPRVEELKVINQNLALEMEVYKKKEVETTQLKDDVTKERSLLVERNVSNSLSLSLLFFFFFFFFTSVYQVSPFSWFFFSLICEKGNTGPLFFNFSPDFFFFLTAKNNNSES
jgi:hypothetical protein